MIVDDFGFNCTNKQHVDELFKILSQWYVIKMDWEGKSFGGITLKWNYEGEQWVELSLPGYIDKVLARFRHPLPKRPQYSPHPAPPTKFTQTTPAPPSHDESSCLDEKGIKIIQKICGSILWYMRSCDTTTTKALNAIRHKQSRATKKTKIWLNWLLDYLATHPEAKIRYWQSDMRLLIHSDASFLVEWDTKSNYGGYFYLGWNQNDGDPQKIKGAANVSALLLPLVAISVAEAELGGTFYNAKRGKVLRLTLEEMGWRQVPTTIFVDNQTASGICNSTIKHQLSRSMNVQYFWLID